MFNTQRNDHFTLFCFEELKEISFDYSSDVFPVSQTLTQLTVFDYKI